MPLTKEEVFAKMKEEDVVLLNVLPEKDFHELHIQGSQNLPLTLDYSGFIQEIERKHGKNKFFITYGDHLSRLDGASAAQAMRTQGFKAENYPGGIQEWFEAGLPTEGTQANAKSTQLVKG
jgi:rhodanese-related sulfurtransferase